MPREGRKFAAVDKMFRATMAKVLADPRAMVAMNDESLLASFVDANKTLDRFGVWGWGLGFGVWGLGFGVWGLGFGVWGLGFGVWGLALQGGL